MATFPESLLCITGAEIDDEIDQRENKMDSEDISLTMSTYEICRVTKDLES